MVCKGFNDQKTFYQKEPSILDMAIFLPRLSFSFVALTHIIEWIKMIVDENLCLICATYGFASQWLSYEISIDRRHKVEILLSGIVHKEI